MRLCFWLGLLLPLCSAGCLVGPDFSYPLEMGLASPLNIAWGGEYRREAYEVSLGDKASWAAGPRLRNRQDPRSSWRAR